MLLLQQLSNHCFTVTDNEELIQNIWIDQCDYGYLHGGGIEDDVFTKQHGVILQWQVAQTPQVNSRFASWLLKTPQCWQ